MCVFLCAETFYVTENQHTSRTLIWDNNGGVWKFVCCVCNIHSFLHSFTHSDSTWIRRCSWLPELKNKPKVNNSINEMEITTRFLTDLQKKITGWVCGWLIKAINKDWRLYSVADDWRAIMMMMMMMTMTMRNDCVNN